MKNSFLYMNIYDDLKKKIDQGFFRDGDRIPSEEELKTRFGVSMITVKKALSMLKEEGLLQRIPGVGTFVKGRTLNNEEEEKESNIPTVKKIGLVMEHVSSSFGLDLLYKLDRSLEESGYKMITRFSYYSSEKETEEIDFLLDSGIEGLIVMPCHGVYYNPRILKLILEGFPVVVIDKKMEGISVPSVRTDNKQAIKTLVKYLWEQGCRKLGFASSEIVGTSSLQERKSGFYEAANEFSMEVLPECELKFDLEIYNHSAGEENIEKAVAYLTQLKGKIHGIVCTEYSLVSAFMEASRRIPIKAGKEIQICCVDGPEDLEIPHMKQNEIEMADEIVKLLTAQINGTGMNKDILVPAILKVQKGSE
ncbi:GntR family transcriptional regulator [Anaerocolumna sp. MB42-C2]|uniref:GntR family transcriptional regulator n=1 Tax=Anaerocolumna sp. MB42-C2 TaxID=3070997 RepID=UPI0027DF7311|nr:GntR family transcriptional regulator [Anaerocolumna sp. MB42-C2]WMJ90609.1 GntR family transcriptional regulator [Anaerocolumna sp. MB42-C2]